MFFVFNTYTASALLAMIGSIIVVAFMTKGALLKKRVIGASLTSLFVTPCVVALVYIYTTWSWLALTLVPDFHTSFILYGWKPVILLHLAASLARALLPASWFPAGVVGSIVGCGSGILVGMRRSGQTQGVATGRPTHLSRRALFLGGPLALGILALPGVVAMALNSRRGNGIFSTPRSPHTLTPGPGWTLSHSEQSVNAVTLSPDGSRVAFGGNDGLLQVWSVVSQKRLLLLSRPNAPIESVGWSPDGKFLASSGGTVLSLWDAQDGTLLGTYTSGEPHSTSLFPLAWSPDGSYIAASEYWAGRVYVWRVTDGTHLYTCDGISVNWSPDGRYLATSSGPPDSPLRAWVRDAHTGTLLFTYEGFGQSIGGQGANFSNVLAWSPDSQRIAMGAGDTVHIWNALNGGNLKQYHVPNIDALVWLPGSGLMVTGDNNGVITSWHVADDFTVVHTYKPLDPQVISRTWALTSTPDGAFIAAGFLVDGFPKTLVQVWETQKGKLLFQYQLKA